MKEETTMANSITPVQATDYAHLLLSDQLAVDGQYSSSGREEYNAAIVHMVIYKTGMTEDELRASVRRAADVNKTGDAQESVDMLAQELMSFGK
jgi:hypothetical protein